MTSKTGNRIITRYPATISASGSTWQLLLDFDSLDLVEELWVRLPFVIRKLDLHVESVSYEYSSSRRGFHVVVGLLEWVPANVVVILQALLASDWRRETFNMVRVLSLPDAPTFWRKRWNVLYGGKWRMPE